MHNDQLPFLDTLMTVKEDLFFGFQVYRKPTHTDKYLKWNSNHPTCHRLYVIDNFVKRALRNCDADKIVGEMKYNKTEPGGTYQFE